LSALPLNPRYLKINSILSVTKIGKTNYLHKKINLLCFFIYRNFFMKTTQQILQEKEYKDLISIDPDRPVVDALIIMAEYKIGALVVLKNNKMVGIISERDYAREIILKGRSSKTTTIAEIMTKEVLTLSPTDNFEKGLNIMTENRIRHLPVLKDDEVLGVLSQGDLVKEMIAHQKNLIEQLETFIKN
jgi:CBS domain-containing protein